MHVFKAFDNFSATQAESHLLKMTTSGLYVEECYGVQTTKQFIVFIFLTTT